MAALAAILPPTVTAAAPGAGDPPPVDPSQLLLGLPGPAAQRLVGHLDSRAMTALMRTSQGSRALVVAHAASATYTLLGAAGASTSTSWATLHALAGRSGGELRLTLPAAGGELAQLLAQAVDRGGWGAVRALHLQGLTETGCAGAPFSHLVGPACPGLRSLVVEGRILNHSTVQPALFTSLSACTQLTHLGLRWMRLDPAAAQQQAELLPQCASSLTSLELTHCPQALMLIGALAGQLTSLDWPEFAPPTGWEAAVAACTRLEEVRLGKVEGRAWLDALAQLPRLKRVTVGVIKGSLAPDGPGSAPDTSCSWDSLTVETAVAVHQLPWLPLRGLQRLQLSTLKLKGEAEGQDSDALYASAERAATALLALAQQGRLGWSTVPEIKLAGLQAWATAVAPLARLAEYLPASLTIHVHEKQPRLVTGAQLAPLLISLGRVQAARLTLFQLTPGEWFWAALQQMRAGIAAVCLYHCGQINAADMALWLAAHPHALRLELRRPSQQARAAVQYAQQRLAQRVGVSQVAVVMD